MARHLTRHRPRRSREHPDTLRNYLRRLGRFLNVVGRVRRNRANERALDALCSFEVERLCELWEAGER